MADDQNADVSEVIDFQMETQGVGVITVSDGTVFMFSTEVLETLLAKSIEGGGKAMVFIKRQAQQ